MNLLINTSNLNKGGALQVAHSFLSEIKNNKEHIFHVVLSNTLSKQIDEKSFPQNFKFYHYTLKPNLIKAVSGKDSFLSNLEKKLVPDCVFTVFGPSYWNPVTKNVVGFADGWCYNPESAAFDGYTLLFRLKRYLMIRLKVNRIKKESDLLIVETNDAKNRISSLLRIPSSGIKVISNTFHAVYNLNRHEQFDIKSKLKDEFKLITISANYPHKNLKIIRQVIPYLKDKGLKVRFYLTIDDKSYQKMFMGFENYVTNLGHIDIKFGPSVYKQCDALFLPTLLETFTASYPEAMKMGKPILTSDLSFARDICGDAAEYFDPLNPKDIADKIEKIMSDHELRNYLIEQGKKRLEIFETSKSRAEKYLAICNQIVKENESISK